MYGSGIQHVLVCPSNSSEASIQGTTRLDVVRCLCDSGYQAVGEKCTSGPTADAGAGTVQSPPAQSPSSPPPPGKPSGAATPVGNDPCLDKPATVEAEPNKARCPLSWRAWDVRRYLHVQRGKSVVELQKSAVAVGEGKVNGKLVRYITTNNVKLDQFMRNPKIPLLADEDLGFPPRGKEHAEQAAERTFEAKGVDKLIGVKMESDPKGCSENCTPRYQNHSWIHHERPTLQ